MKQNDEPIRCPKCGSSQIHAHKRGFKTGRAAAGFLITGWLDVTAIAGAAGMNKIRLTCLKCGNEFKPGEIYIDKEAETLKRENLKEFEKHIISKEEAEKTVLYKCDCGKESHLFPSQPICPVCGRRQKESNIFTPDYKSKGGCFGTILIATTILITILIAI
jgi:DNA-directed RNA polymerase subunit RPC12/RpoP